jgi:hypothetical protein
MKVNAVSPAAGRRIRCLPICPEMLTGARPSASEATASI